MYKNNYSLYIHTLKQDNRKYIGISNNPIKRWGPEGRGYSKNCRHFYYAIQKYGWDNFLHEIVYNNLSKDEAEQKEIELIKLYKTINSKYGFNLSSGGNVPCLEGELNPFYGKTHSKETKEKISKTKKEQHIVSSGFGGHKHTEESKRKISESGKGKKYTEETKRKISEHKKNPSAETRRKMSEAAKLRHKLNPIVPWNKGKHWSDEMKEKLSKAAKNRKRGDVNDC